MGASTAPATSRSAKRRPRHPEPSHALAGQEVVTDLFADVRRVELDLVHRCLILHLVGYNSGGMGHIASAAAFSLMCRVVHCITQP